MPLFSFWDICLCFGFADNRITIKFMVDRIVGIADTSSFRYFGVMPPLEGETIQKVKNELELPWWNSRVWVEFQ